MSLQIPCAYQGSKQKLASEIIDIIFERDMWGTRFYDLCCGSGAISIELVNRGYNPREIIMVDKSPWGLFWKSIGNGTFDSGKFSEMCSEIPSDLSKVQSYVKELSKQSAEIDTEYVFIILQSASFGSKQVTIENGKWKHQGFRNYWMPTPTSVRRSPVVPMTPLAPQLADRVSRIAERMYGVTALQEDVENLEIDRDSIVYIDPPYSNVTGYKYNLDVTSVVNRIGKCYVSEGVKMVDTAYLLSTKRKNSSITGNNNVRNKEEWLNVFGIDER